MSRSDKMNKTKQGCLCVRPSVSSVCSSVTSDKVHVRPISKYSSIFEHILENIHRICPLRPIPNRQNRSSVRPSRPSTTSLPPNTSDKTTLKPSTRKKGNTKESTVGKNSQNLKNASGSLLLHLIVTFQKNHFLSFICC
jgi:hypothetical protein